MNLDTDSGKLTLKVTAVWTAPEGCDRLGTPSIEVDLSNPQGLAVEDEASHVELERTIRQSLFMAAMTYRRALLGEFQGWVYSCKEVLRNYRNPTPCFSDFKRAFEVDKDGLSYIHPSGPSDSKAFCLLVSDWTNPSIYHDPRQAKKTFCAEDGRMVEASEVVQTVRQLCEFDETEPGRRPVYRDYSYGRFDVPRWLSKEENDTKWLEVVYTATRVALDYHGLREAYGPSLDLVPAKDLTMYPSLSQRDDTRYNRSPPRLW